MKSEVTLLIILSLLLFGCGGGLEVGTDYDTKYDYSGLKKYGWLELDKDEAGNVLTERPELYKRGRTAVNRALYAKGYKIAVNEDPDFLVDIYFGIERINKTVDNRPGGREHRSGNLDFTESAVAEGTIIVDFYPPDSSYVLWRGVAEDEYSAPDQYETEESKQQRADYILYQILREFPPEFN